MTTISDKINIFNSNTEKSEKTDREKERQTDGGRVRTTDPLWNMAAAYSAGMANATTAISWRHHHRHRWQRDCSSSSSSIESMQLTIDTLHSKQLRYVTVRSRLGWGQENRRCWCLVLAERSVNSLPKINAGRRLQATTWRHTQNCISTTSRPWRHWRANHVTLTRLCWKHDDRLSQRYLAVCKHANGCFLLFLLHLL